MKTLNSLLFLFLINSAFSQSKKFFFDNIYFSAMAGEEIYQIDRLRWKNMYAVRNYIPYLLDTMQLDFTPKSGAFFINFSSALAVMAAKSLSGNSKSKFLSKREIEWRTGLHFKSINYNLDRQGFVSSLNYPLDTTKIHLNNFVRLTQKKLISEWQNTLHFKTRYLLKNKIRFNVGTGLGINTTITNKIEENYSVTTYTWNATAHRFNENHSPLTKNTFKAKSELLFLTSSI